MCSLQQLAETIAHRHVNKAIASFVTNTTVHRKIKDGLASGWQAVKNLWPWGKKKKVEEGNEN